MEKEIFKNPIIEKTFHFALEIIKYTEKLEALRRYVVANQVLKCGTSIGANVREAQMAETKRDFLHKNPYLQKRLKNRNIGCSCASDQRTTPA